MKKRNLLTIVCLVILVSLPMTAQAFEAKVIDRGLTTVTIGWDAAPPGFQGYYKVWRDQVDASGTASNRIVTYTSSDLSKTTLTDLNLQPGTHYRYTVQLYDSTDHLVSVAPIIDACTQQRVSAIEWGYVAVGIIVIILLIAALVYGANAIAGHPVGMAAIIGAFVLGFSLIALGMTAISLVAAC